MDVDGPQCDGSDDASIRIQWLLEAVRIHMGLRWLEVELKLVLIAAGYAEGLLPFLEDNEHYVYADGEVRGSMRRWKLWGEGLVAVIPC